MSEGINIEIVGGANSNIPRETFISESKQKLAQFTEEQLGSYYDTNMQILEKKLIASNGGKPQNLDTANMQTAIDTINVFGMQLIKQTIPDIQYRSDVAKLLQSDLAGSQLALAQSFNSTLNKYSAGFGMASIAQSWGSGDVNGGAENSFNTLVSEFASGFVTDTLLARGVGFIASASFGVGVGIGVGLVMDYFGWDDKVIQMLNQFGNNLGGSLYDLTHGGGGIPLDIFNNFTRGQYDPLILDLDGDGVETVGLDKKVLFDHSNDGTKNGTGWVGKDDGLLVLDRNNNGSIDNGGELFGDNTVLKNGQKAKNSYDALADIDSNKDGVLDSNDADFAKLKIWQDANQDGISQASELKTLAELGIASIKTGAENSTATKLADGNTLAATSSFTRTDGTTGKTGAVNFIADETTRQFTTNIDTSKVAGLPDMQVSGNVRDLREAAALSTDLATKLSNYIAAGNNRSSSDLDAIVKAWAATSSVATLASTLKPGAHPAGGRGTNLTQAEIDKFNVIEKFSGYYGGVANFIDPSDAQDGRTDGRYSGTYYGIELDAAGINRACNEYQIINLSA